MKPQMVKKRILYIVNGFFIGLVLSKLSVYHKLMKNDI